MATKKYAIVKKNVPVYKEAKKGKKIKTYDNADSNTFLTSSKQSGSFVYIDNLKGWVEVSMTKKQTTAQKQTTTLAAIRTKTGKVEGAAFKAAVQSLMKTEKKINDSLLDHTVRLFGMPHRFNRYADMPISKTSQLGRKYAETIVSEAPILTMSPGRPNFLEGFKSSSERKGFITSLYGGADASSSMSAAVRKMLGSNDFRFFTFYTDYASYMSYVNMFCRAAAIYLGIGDKKVVERDNTKSRKYKLYDWSTYKFKGSEAKVTKTEKPKDRDKKSIFSIPDIHPIKAIKNVYKALKEVVTDSSQYVQFYVDPSTSFQETFSNTTGQSYLESMMGGADDKVKELAFLTNALGMGKLAVLGNSAANTVNTAVNNISFDGPIKRIMAAGTTVLSGATMYYPNIYKTSEYNFSYSVTINLTSPYGDRESTYLNIMVPLFHLVAFVIPKQQSANAYATPFLVKASSKGLFSIEMGIVESLSIEKVASSFTSYGIPTEVKVTMSIKDVYPAMMMPSMTQPILFWENETYRNWIASMCGLDMTQPYTIEKAEAVLAMITSTVKDIPQTLKNMVKDIVNNKYDIITKR